jgi:sugar phosphate isomerase/epimerase
MSSLTRRSFCGLLSGGFSCAASAAAQAAVSPPKREGITLSIGNYGMQSEQVEDAIRLIADLGFDGIELSVMPEWDSAPAKLSDARRRTIRRLLADAGLVLTSLMENLTPSAVAAERRQSLDRLKQAAELGQTLSPDAPPLVQTVLGGGNWDEKKDLLVDCLGDWLRLAESNRTVIGIKPHRGGAMSTPAQAVWLLEQLKASPNMGLVYDYSHYALRDLSVAETVKVAYPWTIHIVAKDVLKRGDKVEFDLPGAAGTIDHAEILKSFYDLGYRSDVCCEVSSQISHRPGYDAAAAARTCYQNMNRVFERAHLPRRRRS